MFTQRFVLFVFFLSGVCPAAMALPVDTPRATVTGSDMRMPERPHSISAEPGIVCMVRASNFIKAHFVHPWHERRLAERHYSHGWGRHHRRHGSHRQGRHWH